MNDFSLLISCTFVVQIGCGISTGSDSGEQLPSPSDVAAPVPTGLAGADAPDPLDSSGTGTNLGTPTSGLPGTPAPGGIAPTQTPDPGAAPFAGPTPTGCVTDVTAGKHEFACNGIRHFVTVPPACLTHACGVVIDLHGGTMDAAMEDTNTHMSALGSTDGYLVVQPSAAGNNWSPGIDDEKIVAFLTDFFTAFAVDRSRVHMMGFSQGGFMTWRLLCKHADWFASVSPGGAGTMVPLAPQSCAFAGADMPSAEVPILHLAGTKDAFISIDSARAQRDAVVAAWGMTGPETEDGPGFRRMRYTSPAGTVYEFLEHDYETDAMFIVAIKGHCYPGSTDHAAQMPGQLMGFGCKGDNAFHWGEEAIRFFAAHPKSGAATP